MTDITRETISELKDLPIFSFHTWKNIHKDVGLHHSEKLELLRKKSISSFVKNFALEKLDEIDSVRGRLMELKSQLESQD